VGVESIADHTAIELTGTDRPGLLSEVSAVLTQMQCNVNAAEGRMEALSRIRRN
jgi:predicted amino acid-binding ACT domain protein